MNSLFSFEKHEKPLVAYLEYIANRERLEPLLDQVIFKRNNEYVIKTPSQNCLVVINNKVPEIKINRLNQEYDKAMIYQMERKAPSFTMGI